MAERYNTDPALGGIKKDTGKRLWHLFPDPVVEGVVDILMQSSQPGPNGEEPKYDEFNWAKGMPYTRVYNSLRRHLNAWMWYGEEVDPDSGKHHLDHLIANAIFLRYYTQRRPELDDRPRLFPKAEAPPPPLGEVPKGRWFVNEYGNHEFHVYDEASMVTMPPYPLGFVPPSHTGSDVHGQEIIYNDAR